MTRGRSMQDASCAICMESLFFLVDDLDVVLPITTPDCGHVFHEHCLTCWFQRQTAAYLDAERDEGNETPSEDDAPIHCPTCREEVYANNQGEPDIHRLFIHFGDDAPAQTQLAASSPSGARGSTEDRQVLALARRAREMDKAVEHLNAESDGEEIDATLGRVQALTQDLVSVKAITGIKTYIGSLTTSLAALRSTLETHPGIQHLLGKVAILEERNKQTEADMRDLVQKTLPEQVRKAVSAERAQAEKRAARVESALAAVRQELSKETVGKKHAVKALETFKDEADKTTASLKKELDEETRRANSLSAALYERTKQLKAIQAKAESRKDLKKENQQLRAEITRLGSKQAQGDDAQDGHGADSQSPADRDMRMAENDQSLTIDYSFDDSRATLSSPPERVVGTLRTITCNIDDADVFGSTKIMVDKPHSSRKDKSKYFAPSRAARSKAAATNDPAQCLVPPSSSPQVEKPSPRGIRVGAGPSVLRENKKRTNPFARTMEASGKPKSLKTNLEIVDLTDDSPDSTRSGHANRPPKGSYGNPYRAAMVRPLVLADANGQPLKNVASGPKARRRV